MSEDMNQDQQLNEADYWLFVGEKLRVAQPMIHHDDGSVTVRLFRNLDDYRSGRDMDEWLRYRP